eukprot:Rmarinus@m.17658
MKCLQSVCDSIDASLALLGTSFDCDDDINPPEPSSLHDAASAFYRDILKLAILNKDADADEESLTELMEYIAKSQVSLACHFQTMAMATPSSSFRKDVIEQAVHMLQAGKNAVKAALNKDKDAQRRATGVVKDCNQAIAKNMFDARKSIGKRLLDVVKTIQDAQKELNESVEESLNQGDNESDDGGSFDDGFGASIDEELIPLAKKLQSLVKIILDSMKAGLRAIHSQGSSKDQVLRKEALLLSCAELPEAIDNACCALYEEAPEDVCEAIRKVQAGLQKFLKEVEATFQVSGVENDASADLFSLQSQLDGLSISAQ